MRRFVLVIAIFAQGAATPCFATEILGAIGPLDDKPCLVTNRAERARIESDALKLPPEEIRRARTLVACLGNDSVRVAKQVIWNWLEQTSRYRDPPTSSTVLPKSAQWSEEALLGMLASSDRWTRAPAYAEAGRRRSKPGLERIRERLENNRGPDGKEFEVSEALQMLEAEGVARDTAAVPQLMRYATIPNAGVRRWVYRALASIGDRRALGVLRPALMGPCDVPNSFGVSNELLEAIAVLGDEDDIPELVHRARSCPRERSDAIAAAGAIAGARGAFVVLEDVWGPHPNLYSVFHFYAETVWTMKAMVGGRKTIR